MTNLEIVLVSVAVAAVLLLAGAVWTASRLAKRVFSLRMRLATLEAADDRMPNPPLLVAANDNRKKWLDLTEFRWVLPMFPRTFFGP